MHWHGDPILRRVEGRLRRGGGGSTRTWPDRLCWWPKTTSLFRAFRARLINRLTQSTPWFRTSFPDKNNWKKNWGKSTFFWTNPYGGGYTLNKSQTMRAHHPTLALEALHRIWNLPGPGADLPGLSQVTDGQWIEGIGGGGKLSTRTPGFTIQMRRCHSHLKCQFELMGQTQASKRLSAAAPIFELFTSPLSGGTFMGFKRIRWYKMDLAPVNTWPQQSWKGEFLDPRIGQEPMILSSPSQSPAGGASQLFWATPGKGTCWCPTSVKDLASSSTSLAFLETNLQQLPFKNPAMKYGFL